MKKYVIIEIPYNGKPLVDVLDTDDEFEAFCVAENAWRKMSAAERKSLKVYALLFADIDEDGEPIDETADLVCTWL